MEKLPDSISHTRMFDPNKIIRVESGVEHPNIPGNTHSLKKRYELLCKDEGGRLYNGEILEYHDGSVHERMFLF